MIATARFTTGRPNSVEARAPAGERSSASTDGIDRRESAWDGFRPARPVGVAARRLVVEGIAGSIPLGLCYASAGMETTGTEQRPKRGSSAEAASTSSSTSRCRPRR